jgi:hypothetical protein
MHRWFLRYIFTPDALQQAGPAAGKPVSPAAPDQDPGLREIETPAAAKSQSLPEDLPAGRDVPGCSCSERGVSLR